MTRWLLLLGAILSEVSASLSLKAAIDEPLFYVVVVAGFTTAFAFLAAVLRRGMGIGVAYGIWAASGVALTTSLSSVIYGEPFTGVMTVGIALIISGVLLVELGSHRTAQAEGSTT